MNGLDKKITYFVFCLIFFLGLSLPVTTFGAQIYFDTPSVSVFSSTKDWHVDLLFDAEGESVNAIFLDIVFDETLVEFIHANQDDTIVTSWLESPKENGNHIILSGIMAGGFSGLIDPVTNTKGPAKIARFFFHPKKEGSSEFVFQDVFVASNDGLGSSIETSALSFSFTLSKEGIAQGEIVADKRPPEVFKPMVSNDESIFNGQYFLVFETRDIGSGVDYYEVKEGRGSWYEAVSPYQINDQTLRKQIYVKAVDKSGNIRVVKTFDSGIPVSNVFIIIILIVVSYLLSKFSLKKRFNKSIIEK